VIVASLNGARTPQTTTAKQLWNGAGKTELAFVEISEIAGSTVSLRVVRRRYRHPETTKPPALSTAG